MTNVLKLKPPETHKPYTRLRTPEAQAMWSEMLAYYEDWTPDSERTLANMCNDAGIIAECDRKAEDPGLSDLAITRNDVRRDRAIKRFERARQCLNLDQPPKDVRPPRSQSRYAGRG